jgi:hypothetical protein
MVDIMFDLKINGLDSLEIWLKSPSVGICQEKSLIVDGQIDKFGEEFRSTKRNIRWSTVDDRASTKLGEV